MDMARLKYQEAGNIKYELDDVTRLVGELIIHEAADSSTDIEMAELELDNWAWNIGLELDQLYEQEWKGWVDMDISMEELELDKIITELNTDNKNEKYVDRMTEMETVTMLEGNNNVYMEDMAVKKFMDSQEDMTMLLEDQARGKKRKRYLKEKVYNWTRDLHGIRDMAARSKDRRIEGGISPQPKLSFTNTPSKNDNKKTEFIFETRVSALTRKFEEMYREGGAQAQPVKARLPGSGQLDSKEGSTGRIYQNFAALQERWVVGGQKRKSNFELMENGWVPEARHSSDHTPQKKVRLESES